MGRLHLDQRGQDLVEYAVIVGTIGLAMFGILVATPGFPDALTAFAETLGGCVSLGLSGPCEMA